VKAITIGGQIPNTDEYYAIIQSLDNGYFLFACLGCLLGYALLASPWPERVINRLMPRLPTPRLNLPLILALAAGLRAPRLFESMWYDETFTGVVARGDLSDLITVVGADVHPPLFYALEWLLVRFVGVSDLSLRSPALVFGLISIYLVYRLTRRVFDKRAALVAAFLVALLPSHIYYSTEARQYTLLLVVVLVALIGVVEKRRAWLLVGAWLPLIHAHGYIYLGWLTLAYVSQRRVNMRYLAALIGPGALWLVVMVKQAGDVANGFWIPPFSWSSVPKVWPMTIVSGVALPPWLALLVFTLFFALITVALWSTRYYLRKHIIIVVVIVGIPLSTALVSALWHNVYLGRAMLASGVLLVIPVAGLVTRSTAPTWRALVYLVVVIPLIGSYAPGARRPDYKTLLATDCDYVYTLNTHVAVIARYYSQAPVYVWTESDDLDQSLPTYAKTAMGLQVVDGFDQVPAGVVCIPHTTSPYTLHKTPVLEAITDGQPETTLKDTDLVRIALYRVNHG
jgi:hypothetical protein